MNVNQGVPCAPENAVRELRALPVQRLLALDEELRQSAYYLNEASVGRNFVLSPAAAPLDETTAYHFSACCHSNGHIREASLKAGHSARVGAAQDLLALNISLASVMQARRWKDTRMPIRWNGVIGGALFARCDRRRNGR